MSYSFSSIAAPKTDIRSAFTDEIIERGVGYVPAEQRPAAQAAVDLAIHTAQRYANLLGDGYDRVTVTISGHANENAQPSSAWANDCLTVALGAIKAEPVEADRTDVGTAEDTATEE